MGHVFSAYVLSKMYCTDKALKDAKASLLEVQELLKTWEAQYASADKKLKTERATCSTLKVCLHWCAISSTEDYNQHSKVHTLKPAP